MGKRSLLDYKNIYDCFARGGDLLSRNIVTGCTDGDALFSFGSDGFFRLIGWICMKKDKRGLRLGLQPTYSKALADKA